MKITEATTITVCIPCHISHVKRLEPLFKSLELQTRLPEEVIVLINPVKEDERDSIVTPPTTLNVNFILSENSNSPASARNECVKHVITKDDTYNNIISFMDADDIPNPNKLQYVEDFFNSPVSYMDDGVALVHSFQTNNESFSEDPMTGYTRYEPCEIDPTCTNLQVKSKSSIHHGHVSVKKEVFDSHQYNPDYYRGEDGLFLQEIIKKGKKVFFLNKILMSYNTDHSFVK